MSVIRRTQQLCITGCVSIHADRVPVSMDEGAADSVGCIANIGCGARVSPKLRACHCACHCAWTLLFRLLFHPFIPDATHQFIGANSSNEDQQGLHDDAPCPPKRLRKGWVKGCTKRRLLETFFKAKVQILTNLGVDVGFEKVVLQPWSHAKRCRLRDQFGYLPLS